MQHTLKKLSTDNVRDTYARMLRETGNIPTTLSVGGVMFTNKADAVDAYQRLYEERTSLERQAKLVKAQEDDVKDWLQKMMERDHIPMALGEEWAVDLTRGVNAVLQDYDAFTRYVASHRAQGAFGLLYRRINQETVREWSGMGLDNNGVIVVAKPIPGLGTQPYTRLHHRKRG